MRFIARFCVAGLPGISHLEWHVPHFIVSFFPSVLIVNSSLSQKPFLFFLTTSISLCLCLSQVLSISCLSECPLYTQHPDFLVLKAPKTYNSTGYQMEPQGPWKYVEATKFPAEHSFLAFSHSGNLLDYTLNIKDLGEKHNEGCSIGSSSLLLQIQ